MTESFDVIVIGAGGIGSAATYHLASRGINTLAIDPFPIAHDRGSSHGETRAIRKAYFEHPDYVPLLKKAYKLWHELEINAARTLYHQTGILLSGPPNGDAIKGARLSARQHGIPIEDVTSDADARFPGFRFPEHHEVVFEPEAGFLHVEQCVQAHADLAAAAGADFRIGETVIDWASEGQTVTVTTNSNQYHAASLVVTAGAWSGAILSKLIPLKVLRKGLFWFDVTSSVYNLTNNAPVFLFEMPVGVFYGFPSVDGHTVKMAEHTGGNPVVDPSVLSRSCSDQDMHAVSSFARQIMTDLDPTPKRHSFCMYTMTPDQHFVIDRHPEYSNVVFGAGFSGHGFKFATVLGEALADLALDRKPSAPIEFLSLKDRF